MFIYIDFRFPKTNIIFGSTLWKVIQNKMLSQDFRLDYRGRGHSHRQNRAYLLFEVFAVVDVGVVDPWLLQVAAHASTGIASLDSLRFAFGRTYLAAAATARHAARS